MLERNRAERRSKSKTPILFKGIPYLIFAALAAGYLAGVPSAVATSAIAQRNNVTVTRISGDDMFLPLALGVIGRTNAAGSVSKIPSFAYSGTYSFFDDGRLDGVQNWRIKFLTSGTLVFSKSAYVDIWAAGAGGGGSINGTGTGGAGGGYTNKAAYQLIAGTSYTVVVGAGGARGGARGGTTSISVSGTNILSAEGGYGTNSDAGGNGGSGGGGYAGSAQAGGTDGSNGAGASNYGIGQHTTTREFHEPAGTLYCTGGTCYADNSGAANTGNGGGGRSTSALTGIGGSGILVIRNQRAA